MSDHPEKGHKHEKTPDSKSQQVMQPHHNQGHRHHHYHHHADDNKHNNIHSIDDIRDRQPNHQNQQDYDKTHHHHPHHCHHKQNYCHVSESTNTSSLSSSSSASTSSSTSSLSTSSFSPSLLSSSSSTMSSSSSSLSSEDSSECSDRYHPKRPQHSQSFTDISGKHKYIEEDDDTAPLINARGHLNRSSAKQRRDTGKFSLNGPTKENGKKKHSSTRQLGNDGSFRKAKSMDDLTPTGKAGDGTENGDEHESSKSEARENVLKEKMKFSAFLNEITRQVLSPMRLSSLGVTDTQRSHSPGRVVGKSGEKDSVTDKPKQWRSQPASPDSISSSKHSHTSKQSRASQLSRSKSFHHHERRSASPASHMKHRSRSCHSCSPSPERPLDLPPRKLGRLRHREECNNQSQCYQHRNHHHQGHHHNPAYKRRDHHSPVYYSASHLHKDKRHKDHYNPTRHDGKRHSASHCHDHHVHSDEYHHNEHSHDLRDTFDSNHHHDDHHNNHPTLCPTTPCHFDHRSPTSNDGTHRGLVHQHHHGDHHRDAHQHHPDDHHLHHESHHTLGHHQHHNEAHEHHYDDHHKDASCHNHRDHHNPSYWHPSQHHHGKPQHHLENHHTPGHSHFHGDHQSKHHHHYRDQHNDAYHHRHGDHSKPYLHGNHHSDDQHNQHHHRDLHSPTHHHHHGNHHSETRQHDHEDHHSLVHHYRNKAYHHHRGDQPSEVHHRHQDDQQSEAHHYENHYNQDHDYRRGDYNITSHCQGCHLESQSHLKPCKPTNNDNNELGDDPLHLTERSANDPASHRKPESLVSKNSTSNTDSLSCQDEEQTSFNSPSTHDEKTHELGRIMILDQNEGLHQSLMKTAVQVECLGEEFISSQKLLEADLQRTRMELSSLMEKFQRLQDDCSSTQQTNNLLEKKLHSMLQNMEGERERLNQRISELTEQLTDATIATTMEAINTTSAFHKSSLHSSDNGLIQMVPPITPPPAQFMDNHNCGQDKSSGQEQPLGSVPEEEESDWSEVGEETPRLVLTGSSRGQTWRRHEADVDKDCESGSEELVRRHFPHPLQIPHLQFTIHNEFLPPAHTTSCPSGFKNLSDSIAGDIEEIYMTTTSPSVKSAILIRSASLEEIPLTRHHMQKVLRGTEAMMNLHHSADEAMEDLDNEIIHHWSSDRDTVIRRLTKSAEAEVEGSMAGLRSAEQMLNHFIHDPPACEGADLGRAGAHGWAGGIPGKVLNVARTQL